MAALFRAFSVLFIVLLLWLVDSVQQCDHLAGEKGAGFFAFIWFVACVLSALVCWLFLMGQKLVMFLVIYYTCILFFQ